MTGRIAPDTGREIDLVLAGDKPLAVIEKRKDPDQYRRVYLDPKLDRLAVIFRIGADGAEVVVAQSSILIGEYLEALHSLDGDAKTRTLGRLFGYSEADIQVFIDDPPECDCSKCRLSIKIWTHAPQKFGPAIDNARRTQFWNN